MTKKPKKLRVGGTIWLNPSEKLLKNKKWLRKPFEKMPKEVQKEAMHHSHTHPNATVTSSTTDHTHDQGSTPLMVCSFTGSTNHFHYVDFNTTDSHNHIDTVVSFGSANLGSPNWWEHVHAVTLSSMGNAGAAHTHSQSDNEGSYCTLSGCKYSYHWHTAANTANGGAAHTHTIPANNTSNATQAGGTAEAHVHPFSFTFVVYTHSHVKGAFNAGACAKGKSHTHTFTGSTTGGNHDHTANGNSGSGGEAAAAGPVNLKTYNTNVKANIKTINTNVIANVKTLDTNA